MYRLTSLVVAVVMLAAACGGDGTSTTEAPGTSVTTTEPNPASSTTESPPDARAIVERMLQASAAGDYEGWRESFARDAEIVFIGGGRKGLFDDGFSDDDFDGDGARSTADGIQYEIALNPAMQHSGEATCTALSADEAECTTTWTDGFIEAGEGPPGAHQMRYVVRDGLIIVREWLSADMDRTIGAWSREIGQYERWVRDTYPDSASSLFRGPCCGWDGFIKSPDTIALHEELMDEYLSGTH